ncbi:MAG TPA: diguanylate cyclase [Longimicrobium sp.]|nr:diguanylate cyclase [Longimicrobium sp.]
MDSSPALAATPAASPSEAARARIDALNDEAWPLRFTERERAEALANEALDLAEAEGHIVGRALALRTLGVQRYYFRSDFEGALEMLQRALSLLDEAGEAGGRADVLNGIGYVHLRRGEHAEAVRLHLEALRLHRSIGDRAGESSSLNLLGIAAYRGGDYGAALEYHQASMALREQAGDRAGVGHALINIGIVYGEMGEMERLLEYMQEALLIHEGHDALAASACLNNIGNAYRALGDADRALEYLERAASGFRAIGHVDETACLCEIGRLHEARGDYAAARACYERALGLGQQMGATMYAPEILICMGMLQMRQLDELDSGFAHLTEALRRAEAQEARQYVYAAHEALAEAYERRGDTARALEHHRAFHAVWKDVFGTETSVRIQNVRVQAEVQQSEREAEILREKNEALTRADEEKARLLEQLRQQAAELERQTREDALTGVFNRRHLDTLLGAEWERAVRFGRALTVAMLDIDHFKDVNDCFSHAVGDEVLRTVARILRDNTRGVDSVARYGGEEFCLLLVETDVEEGARLCDRLRARVESHDWSGIRPGLAVTISAGVAGSSEAEAPDALLAAADVRLYAAKHQGRNRVCAD